MNFLHLINIFGWLVLLFHCGKSYWGLRGSDFNKEEIIVIAITLLTALNISMWTISTIIMRPNIIGVQLLDYINFGISAFQLLICNFILSNIKSIARKIKE